jgi:predicted transcriptional regulator
MILSGTKRYEYRRALYRDRSVRTIILYATKPIAKVVGEFEVGGLLSGEPEKLWACTRDHSGISKQHFLSYFRDKATAFAIHVKKPVRYDKPLALSELEGVSSAPQSFLYLSGHGDLEDA